MQPKALRPSPLEPARFPSRTRTRGLALACGLAALALTATAAQATAPTLGGILLELAPMPPEDSYLAQDLGVLSAEACGVEPPIRDPRLVIANDGGGGTARPDRSSGSGTIPGTFDLAAFASRTVGGSYHLDVTPFQIEWFGQQPILLPCTIVEYRYQLLPNVTQPTSLLVLTPSQKNSALGTFAGTVTALTRWTFTAADDSLYRYPHTLVLNLAGQYAIVPGPAPSGVSNVQLFATIAGTTVVPSPACNYSPSGASRACLQPLRESPLSKLHARPHRGESSR